MSEQKRHRKSLKNAGSVNTFRLRVQSQYRLGYFKIFHERFKEFEAKFLATINDMPDETVQEKTIREHSFECLNELSEICFLVDRLRTDGPAKAILMINRHGEIIDTISGKAIDENEAFNQILDNHKH